MSPPRTVDPPGSLRPSVRRLLDSDHFAFAVAFIVAVIIAATADPTIVIPPRTVELHLTNPTDYTIAVHASDEHGDEWVPLGIVEAGRDLTLETVLDQGDSWTFQFRGQGRDAGQVRLTRTALEQADWRLEIPQDAAARLRDQGTRPNIGT